MGFLEIVGRAKLHLREQGRVSLRALKREFDLDDEALEELVEELVDLQQVAAREGQVLSWVERSRTPLPARRLSSAEPEEEPADEGERRQLTVMFCDLVGSTRLAAGLDPEDWRELVRGYQKTAAAAVERFDGHVAQYLGDGILVYFGYPRRTRTTPSGRVRAGLRHRWRRVAGAESPARRAARPRARAFASASTRVRWWWARWAAASARRRWPSATRRTSRRVCRRRRSPTRW